MGLADRDYQRDTPSYGGGFFQQLTPVVKWLLIVNVAIFFLDYIIFPLTGISKIDEFNPPLLRRLGAFSIHDAFINFHLWKLITFQFLHGGLVHVMFNSITLFFFGPWVERWWGPTKFLIFYLLSGVGGALFFTLLVVTGILPGDGLNTPLVGASAGIYGILIGASAVAPDLRVRLLFPPIELSMRQLALALIAFSVGMIVFGIGGNEGGEAGHLGGAIVGFGLIKFPWLLGNRTALKVVRPKPAVPRQLPKLRPRSEIEKEQDTAVDKILDKISREGLHSLTQDEKDLLQKVSNQKRSS